MEPLEKFFVSQFELDYPLAVRKTACGLASLAMAEFVVSGKRWEGQVEANLNRFIRWAKSPRPRIFALFQSHPNVPFPIAYQKEGESAAAQLQKAAELAARLSRGGAKETFRVFLSNSGDREYRPTWSVSSGTDARGVVAWLKRRGLEAALFEFGSESPCFDDESHRFITDRGDFIEIFDKFCRGEENAALIVSIEMRALGYPHRLKYVSDPGIPSTHMVVVVPAREPQSVCFLDPSMTRDAPKIFVRSSEDFIRAFCPKERRKAHFVVVGKNKKLIDSAA